MEMMIVAALIGIMAAFSIPNYNKSLNKSHEKDMIAQLKMIKAAADLYYAREQEYPQAALANITDINNTLKILVMADEKTYLYTPGAASDEFTVNVAKTGAGTFTARITQEALKTGSFSPNPCCVNPPGGCPALGNC